MLTRARPAHLRPVPVVHRCATCGRYSHPVVQFEERGDPIVLHLPDNCVRCGTSIDTPETIADLIDVARLLRTFPVGPLGGAA